MEEPLNQEQNPYGLYEEYDDLCAELSALPPDAKIPSHLTKQIQDWAIAYVLAWGMERLPEDIDKQKYGQLPGVNDDEQNKQKDVLVSEAAMAYLKKDYKPMIALIDNIGSDYDGVSVEKRVWDIASKSLESKNTTDNRS